MSTFVSQELHHRITQFLYHEASLLDDWKFRDWLAQLDEDIRYTMRTTVNAQTRDRRKRSRRPPDFQRQQRPARTSYRAAGNRHGTGGRATVAYPAPDQQLPGQ